MEHIELLLLVISLLFFASIFTDKLSSKFGVPALLLFLAVGMLFGEDGLGLKFDDMQGAQLIGSVSLCVILFAGGMSTKFVDIKPVMWPGTMLATVGVALTWLLSGLTIWGVFHLYGSYSVITLPFALLIAATMSSTDAGSVFSILGNKGIRLKHNLRPLLELESGSNDPMAYIITVTMIGILTSGTTPTVFGTIISIIWSVVFGVGVGFGFAKLMISIMKRITISNSSLYPIMILTACLFMYSASYFLGGNSYLAVYIGGLVIGNSKFPHKRNTMNFIDGMSWLCQLLVFLVLGLLVKPTNLAHVAVPALIISGIMILVARPIAVFLTLLPYKQFNSVDKTYISWVGLKGAVPIILAIQCAAEGVPNSDILFNTAFVCTIVSLLTQGTSLSRLARRLHLTLTTSARKAPTHFDINLPEEVEEQVNEVYVTEEMAPQPTQLMHLGLSRKSLVIMLRREDDYIIPKGSTEIHSGDYLLVMSDQEAAIVPTLPEDEIWELQIVRHPIRFFCNVLEHSTGWVRRVWDWFRAEMKVWKKKHQKRRKPSAPSGPDNGGAPSEN